MMKPCSSKTCHGGCLRWVVPHPRRPSHRPCLQLSDGDYCNVKPDNEFRLTHRHTASYNAKCQHSGLGTDYLQTWEPPARACRQQELSRELISNAHKQASSQSGSDALTTQHIEGNTIEPPHRCIPSMSARAVGASGVKDEPSDGRYLSRKLDQFRNRCLRNTHQASSAYVTQIH